MAMFSRSKYKKIHQHVDAIEVSTANHLKEIDNKVLDIENDNNVINLRIAELEIARTSKTCDGCDKVMDTLIQRIDELENQIKKYENLSNITNKAIIQRMDDLWEYANDIDERTSIKNQDKPGWLSYISNILSNMFCFKLGE